MATEDADADPRSASRGGENRRRDHEVAIVGAGAVGLTTAYDLARQGADVTVYERGAVASGSSGRAAGVCYSAFASRPDATLGAEAIERFHAFASEGAPFTSCPYVWLAQRGDDQRIRLIQDGIERMAELGVEAVELDTGELAERFPTLQTDDVAIAGMTEQGGYTDPGEYTEWLASRVRDAGVTIREHTPVEIATDPPRVRFRDEQSKQTEQDVDTLVVAAGAHTKQILGDVGVPIAMKPYRVQALVGTVSVSEATRGTLGDNERATHWKPMWYDASAECYARPHPDGLLAGNGTEEVEADPDSYDRDADDGFDTDLGARVTHRMPDCTLDVQRAWAGLCTATPDRNPLVGKLRDSLYIATGFQGQGFMRSPAIGRRLADEILGGEGIEAFDPTRFDGDEEFDIREGMAIES